MAVIINRISKEEQERRRQESLKETIAQELVNGQLPREEYKNCGKWPILHEPLDATPCEVRLIGYTFMCVNEDHLWP